jgi:type IV secretion system protein VirB10
MSNNLHSVNNTGGGGALPSLDGSGDDEILGVPESKLKARTNVGKTFILLAFLGGALFVVFGALFFMKGRAERAAAQGQQPQKVAVKVDPTKVRNSALESDSLERVKAEIKKKEDNDKEIMLAAAARQQAAAGGYGVAGAPHAGNAAASNGAGGAAGTHGAGGGGYGAPHAQGGNYVAPPRKPSLREQQLAGTVLFGGANSAQGGAPAPVALAAAAADPQRGRSRGFASDDADDEAPARPSQGQSKSNFSGMLQPTILEARRAGRLSNMDFLLKKGMTIPCALRTGIDTTLPGFLTCVAISDVYSANGVTKLVDRGATFFGEQRSAIAQGQARVFVVWTRLDNPSGVYAEIDSPATDEMGYAGVGGYVDEKFWKRFGGAIMLSLIQDTLAAAVKEREESGAVQVTNTSGTSSAMATEALKGTINIPPTITVLPGKIINVMVARDVSFEAVYGLVK